MCAPSGIHTTQCLGRWDENAITSAALAGEQMAVQASRVMNKEKLDRGHQG
jgi:hypothetical protein